jgi:hypothetical protein
MKVKLRWKKDSKNQYYTNTFSNIESAVKRYNWLREQNLKVTWWMD